MKYFFFVFNEFWSILFHGFGKELQRNISCLKKSRHLKHTLMYFFFLVCIFTDFTIIVSSNKYSSMINNYIPVWKHLHLHLYILFYMMPLCETKYVCFFFVWMAFGISWCKTGTASHVDRRKVASSYQHVIGNY